MDNTLNAVVRYSLFAGCVPDIKGIRGFFDFKNVELVAAEIVGGLSAEMRIDIRGPSLALRHFSSGMRVSFEHLARRMVALYGGNFEAIVLEEWIQLTIEASGRTLQ